MVTEPRADIYALRLTKRGNSIMVTIPRPLLVVMHWAPGDTLILERIEDALLLHNPLPHPVAVRKGPRRDAQ